MKLQRLLSAGFMDRCLRFILPVPRPFFPARLTVNVPAGGVAMTGWFRGAIASGNRVVRGGS